MVSTPDDFITHMAGDAPPSPPVQNEIASTIWRIGIAMVVLVTILIGIVLVLFFLRSRDVNERIDSQKQTLTYLCETTTIIDLLIIQEQRALQVSLGGIPPGSRQREFIRERIATLEAAHAELASQRACEEVQ